MNRGKNSPPHSLLKGAVAGTDITSGTVASTDAASGAVLCVVTPLLALQPVLMLLPAIFCFDALLSDLSYGYLSDFSLLPATTD